MIVYTLPVSLYGAKLDIALAHKGMDAERRAPSGGSYRSAEYRALVPTGTIPALEHQGRVLAESDAIIEYLDEIGPPPSLLPGDAAARARIRFVSRLHDLHVEPAVRALFGQIAPQSRDAAIVSAALARLAERFDLAERALDPAPFAAGPHFSLADCGWPPTLCWAGGIATALGADVAPGPKLAALAEALARVPAVAAVMGRYRPAVEGWIAARLAGG
jgi:glutathione S-transferase